MDVFLQVETDFDPTYHWTITGASIEGEEKVAGFAASICYAANGKAYGYIDIPGYYKPGETGHGAIASRAVVFDLYNQKMKKNKGWGITGRIYDEVVGNKGSADPVLQ